MFGPREKKKSFPIPLWLIGFCGILAGGVMAVDQPANAKGAKKKAAAKTAKADTSLIGGNTAETIAPAVVTPDSAGAEAEDSEAASEPIAAAVPTRKHEKIVYGDSPKDEKAPGLGMRNILALLLLASVAGGAMYYAKRKQRAGGPLRQSRTMSLVDTLRLGGRHNISLVHVPGRLLVIGSGEKGMSLLTEMSEEAAMTGRNPQPGAGHPAPNPMPSNGDGLVRHESDEFINHLMNRISQAGYEPPATEAQLPAAEAQLGAEGGAMSLKNRLQQYQFGQSNA
jgi:flagellar biogenesis protein FliO